VGELPGSQVEISMTVPNCARRVDQSRDQFVVALFQICRHGQVTEFASGDQC